MSDLSRNDLGKERQRALFSCDRCKKRKRACKRYDPVTGVRCFDNSTPCENCSNAGDICQTTITRKKRTFYSVSESSIVQLRCLTKIVKAMFPESDPNNFEDIENIAKLLYVQLPDKEKAIRQGTIQSNYGDDGTEGEEGVESVEGTAEVDLAEMGRKRKRLNTEDNDINDVKLKSLSGQVGTSTSDSTHILEPDSKSVLLPTGTSINAIKQEPGLSPYDTAAPPQSSPSSISNNSLRSSKRQNTDTDTDVENENDKSRFSNLKKIADEMGALRSQNNATGAITGGDEASAYTLNENHIGLGGTERLFTALLEVEKRRTQQEGPEIDRNNLLTHVIQQHVKSTFRPSFIINGNDIQKYLVLDSIPQKECLMYADYFFEHIHEGYLMFDEKKFRKRQDEFFEILADKNGYQENLRKYKFSNEEICTNYIVWILGRKGYLLNMVLNNKALQDLNVVSDYVVSDYLNAIHLCLCNVFFSNNISTVRLLYFTSLFHATIKNRNSIWHLIGNTCIKCICLGYTKQYTLKNFSEEEQEEIKIAWWSSFKLHMNNCAVLGRLPNISLNEVDIGLPKLESIHDELFKKTYIASIELFKIMFLILKNREYLIRSKDPWCKQNYMNIMYINNQLMEWEENLDYRVKHYQRPKPKRVQIKLHMQYHYCVSSLIVPYLIAYALKPKESVKSSPEIVKTLCYAINSAIKMVNVILYSSIYLNFNGLLYYDLFYAYNSLMILLLGYTLIRYGSTNKSADDYNVFADVLKKEFKIDISSILNAINNIKGINNRFGSSATSIMKDASTNINLLLKYFKMDGDLSVEESLEKLANEEKEKRKVVRTESVNSNLSDNFSMSNINNAFDNIETIPYKYGNVPLLPSSIPDRGHLSVNTNVNSNVNNMHHAGNNTQRPSLHMPVNRVGGIPPPAPHPGQTQRGSDLNGHEFSINDGITPGGGVGVAIGAGVGGQDYDNLATLDKDFLEIISFMNKETQPNITPVDGDKLFWDWNNLFSIEDSIRQNK